MIEVIKNNIYSPIRDILISNLYAISLYSRRIASAFVVFFIARYLSIEDYGLYLSYVNIGSFLLLFASLGANEYIMVSTNNIYSKVREKLHFFIIASIAILLAISISALFVNFESHFIFSLVLLRVFFDTTFFTLILPYFQSSKKFNHLGIINIFYSICLTTIGIMAFFLKLSLVEFLFLNIFIGVINFFQCLYLMKFDFSVFKDAVSHIFKIVDKSLLYYAFSVVTMAIYGQIPSLFVSFYLSKEEAALYFSAFNISAIILLLMTAQAQQMLPDLITRSYSNIINCLKRNIIFIVSINISLLLFFLFFGKWLLLLIYGKEFYSNAYILLLILTLSNSIACISGIFATFITAQGFQKNKLKLQVEFSLISVIAMFLLCKYGVYGSAMAALTIVIYSFIRYGLFAFAKLRLLKQENNLDKNNKVDI